MKKITLLFATFLLAVGNIFSQTPPTTSWSAFAETQWYNSQAVTFDISTAEQLAGLSTLVAGGNKFIGKKINLTANIDLSAHLWTPIGVSNNLPFSGEFNGNNHVISNLFVNMPTISFTGLFGRCITAKLKNVRIENAWIRGEDSSGALLGNMWKNGTIENCHVTGVDILSTGYNVGGLVGDILEGVTLTRCSAEGNITGYSQIGGLVGSPFDGNTISESYSKGTVTADYIAGGFVGTSLPGFPQTMPNSINNCYSRSNVVVTTGMGCGGFIGGFTSLLDIKNSYATGTATSPVFTGGFAGTAQSTLTSNNYWDTESSALTNAIGEWQTQTPGTADITGKTTAEMKTTAMVAALNQGGTVWKLNSAENDGYPTFTAGVVATTNIGSMNSNVVIYPNTFDAEIQISSQNPLKGYVIYDIAGKTIQTGSLEGKQVSLNTEKIQSGVYLLLIETTVGMISKKIIK